MDEIDQVAITSQHYIQFENLKFVYVDPDDPSKLACCRNDVEIKKSLLSACTMVMTNDDVRCMTKWETESSQSQERKKKKKREHEAGG